MKFKVGDTAKIIKKGSHCQEIGAIVKILEVDEQKKCYYTDCPYNGKWYIQEDELEAVQFTKSDLKDGDIVTYRDGEQAVVLRRQAELRSINKIGLMYLKDYDKELKYKNNKKLDIIKVERPANYETVFERKEEILDEAEKRYLRDVIRPFRDKVRYIEKEDNGEISRIKICFDYHYMFFPILEKEKRMYEGMKANRGYSIKELGL